MFAALHNLMVDAIEMHVSDVLLTMQFDEHDNFPSQLYVHLCSHIDRHQELFSDAAHHIQLCTWML